MRVSVAHTYVPEPEPTLDGLVVDLSTAVDDWDGQRMLLRLGGEGLWAGKETPPNWDSSLAYGSERIRGSGIAAWKRGTNFRS